MTPLEIRALAELATVAFSARVPGSISTDNREVVEKALKALRSLADQVEALESQVFSREEILHYYALKKDAERYRFLKSLEGQERALHVLRFEGAEYLDAQLDRAREAT